jgi:hypothetical protein
MCANPIHDDAIVDRCEASYLDLEYRSTLRVSIKTYFAHSCLVACYSGRLLDAG